PVDFFPAWAAALAYSLQLYFDFSGYSDMAIGAARCFGVRFPANFDSPYKSRNIIEFWRRWHMTLSRFLRDYLYIGLGGNRRGKIRRYVNLLITMALGGLWHGANWTFVAWGTLHGLYLMVNHGWQAIVPPAKNRAFPRLRHATSVSLTLLCVVVGWVFFRSATFGAALNLLAGMAGLHGISIPEGIVERFEYLRPYLASIGITTAYFGGADAMSEWSWIAALLAVVFLMPNTQQIMRNFAPVLEMPTSPEAGHKTLISWRESAGWAIAVGAIAFLSVISITRVSEFLYWQF
ncbi:MAG TPA: MBOAT family O-acyltransferase, partial [Candidatus Binataceae bacterium]|nr:MBOAT family O-acyltransferase [Candidatus Binataceae bacterium]